MKIFVRAIVTGFGLSLGSALYKKVAKHFGFDDDDKKSDKDTDRTNQQDGGDPDLQAHMS